MLVEKAKILKCIKIRLGVVAAQLNVRTVRGAQYTQDHHFQPQLVQGAGSFLASTLLPIELAISRTLSLFPEGILLCVHCFWKYSHS